MIEIVIVGIVVAVVIHQYCGQLYKCHQSSRDEPEVFWKIRKDLLDDFMKARESKDDDWLNFSDNLWDCIMDFRHDKEALERGIELRDTYLALRLTKD